MASDSSTVFRFVTVRNPRKPTNDEVDTGFVSYDPKIKSGVVEAYITKSRNEALALAQKYKQSKDFATKPEQIDERQAGLVHFADWLTAEAHRLTQARLKEFRKTVKVVPTVAVLTWLWDNLAAQVLAGGRPEIRESIVGALRVYKLLERPNLEGLDDEVLQRLASATVIMPARKERKRRDRGEGLKGAAPEPGRAAKMVATLEKISTLQQAADELSRHLGDEIDRARAVEPKALRVPHLAEGCMEPVEAEADAGRISHQAMVLSQAKLAAFSKETQAVLREASVKPGVRLPYAIQRLQSLAVVTAQQAAVSTRAEHRIVQVGGAFWATPDVETHEDVPPRVTGRDDDYYGQFYVNDRQCKVQPLGIADYRRVEQRIYCYEPGEIAHIENVMQGETKDRTTRHLRRTEETLTVSTEEETTKERDSQTTDRFEIEREASKVVESDLSFELGVQVQASYGPVKITADTKFATSNSTTESDKQASKYGRDVTERALERVVKTVREERVTKVLEEYEETNKHALKGGEDEHVVGLFRWVDKVYEARIVNYGKRTMFEFMVPEPGAFHLYAMTKDPIESSVTLSKPIDPRSTELQTELGLPPLTSHHSISEWNYATYAAAYEAKVEPPPALFQTTSKAYHREGMDHDVQFADSKNELKVPDGYEAVSFVAPFGLHSENHDGGPNWVTIGVGAAASFFVNGNTFSSALSGEDDIVPVVVMGRTRFYAMNIEVLCRYLPATLEKWKMKVFNAILDSYNTKLAAYNNAFAEAKSRVGIEIRGTNPATNRQREQIELEKSCIRLLAEQCQPLWSNAMKDGQECSYPEFDCCEAISDGSYVQFLEQCFEWRLMTYLFYPYFWGRKCNWKKIYQLDDADPLFLGFLQSGYAKVVVPVREGYHEAALRFLADGTLWNGGGIPGVNDPLYVSIVNEMKQSVGKVDRSVEPWKIRVPTTLTVLQCDSGCVDGKGLPCPGPKTPWPVS